jgi:S-adenosylmethionine:tRNA-ribosyltransferase-isomerase (queuine synthetase)
MDRYNLAAYNFDLPEELIGQHLASPPDSCRLLVYKKQTQSISD